MVRRADPRRVLGLLVAVLLGFLTAPASIAGEPPRIRIHFFDPDGNLRRARQAKAAFNKEMRPIEDKRDQPRASATVTSSGRGFKKRACTTRC